MLASALHRVLRLPDTPKLTCAGRTDAGVHARDQWAHFDVADDTPVDPPDLRRRLTKLLGPEVVVRDASIAPPGWDARRSALTRTYRYTVLTTPAPDPFRARFVWWRPVPLELRSMQLACDAVLGAHDFSSFCRRQPGKELVRVVRDAGWCEPEPGVLRFEIVADAFCQQMVRSLVGTMVDIGVGRIRAGEMLGILRAKDRAVAGTVAPPEGLVLWHVQYPAEDHLQDRAEEQPQHPGEDQVPHAADKSEEEVQTKEGSE